VFDGNLRIGGNSRNVSADRVRKRLLFSCGEMQNYSVKRRRAGLY
jgi:hypothetical protein